MREIKFRGRRTDNSEWLYGDLIRNQDGRMAIVKPLKGTNNDFYNWEVIPNTVGQYTGLKDKNGKEIYDGDIIRVPESVFNAEIIGVVTFEKDTYYIKAINGGWGASLFAYLDKWEDTQKAYVIGNIHDNPELLDHDDR